MHHLAILLISGSLTSFTNAAIIPRDTSTACLSDPKCGPIPGESSLFVDNPQKSPPFPANESFPIPAIATGPPGADDLLFQNLLGAEWAVFSFYQQGVESLNQSVFTELGLPNTTYERIIEIRDNEAGHLRIFQDSISPNSIKPGPCEYEFPWETAEDYLALQNFIEVSSMAFLTGLVQQAKTLQTAGALVAIGETEARHETWSLTKVYDIDPFSGPADTTFPYANEILYSLLASFIVPHSCPAQNPPYPVPSQNLPQISYNAATSTGHPGSPITFVYTPNLYTGKTPVPEYAAGKDYYAVFFHGVNNISVPFDTKLNSSVVPEAFDANGIILAVIADTIGAPTLDSVVAGPIILLQQPASATNLTAAA